MSEGNRSSTWFWVLGGFGIFILLLCVLGGIGYIIAAAVGSSSTTSFSVGNGKIGVIELTGVILSPDTIVDQLQTFADDDSIRAIVLHVNSPGGGAAASQ